MLLADGSLQTHSVFMISNHHQGQFSSFCDVIMRGIPKTSFKYYTGLESTVPSPNKTAFFIVMIVFSKNMACPKKILFLTPELESKQRENYREFI